MATPCSHLHPACWPLSSPMPPVLHTPYLSAFPSQSIISLFCKTLAHIQMFWVSYSRLRLSKFLLLDFPHSNGKGQMSRDALRRDFLQALLSFMLCCPFPVSTYRSIRLPVEAFCSAGLIQLLKRRDVLFSVSSSCRFNQQWSSRLL